MVSKVKNLVEYTGLIDEDEFKNYTTCFRKFVLRETAIIPEGKPDIGTLVRVAIGNHILETKIIRTEKGVSLDGQISTGRKVLVDSEINIRLEYVDCKECNEVHSIYFDIPYSRYVVIPEENISLNRQAIKVHILNCLVDSIDPRTVVVNLIILIMADC